MCAQFALKIKANELSLKYGIQVPEDLVEIQERYLPYKKAPVIVRSNGLLKLVRMNFSLVPSWAKESKLKFATHNARLETVTEKPTWRKSFQSQHCVIPLTSFFESVYHGPFAGHVINFHPAADDLLFAAGIFDKWQDHQNQKEPLYSFSILTTPPSEFILNNGHDRSPLFLEFDFAQKWLDLRLPPPSMVDFLLQHQTHPHLLITEDRPLKPGWEKRK